MLEENGSKHLLEQPGHTPEKAETSSEVPQASADFGMAPNETEAFGKAPQAAERQENHTLTVRETARMFETAGVARTERSVINWCQPNRQGIARLDSYYDPNERKYYITPQSVETARHLAATAHARSFRPGTPCSLCSCPRCPAENPLPPVTVKGACAGFADNWAVISWE
jgi:hypothetical protein